MMTTHITAKSKYSLSLIAFIVMGLVSSCGGAAAPTETASLSTPTPIPTFQFVQPTAAPQLATLAASTMNAVENNSTTELDPERVSRGEDRYAALECGSCHGANGEGTDGGSALSATSLNEEDFISFLRSGGTVGISHQFSTNRLSDSGSRNLYQYILSLGSE